MLSFLRIFKFALQDIGRNIGLSFMTVFVLVLMLLSLNTLFFVRLVTNEATTTIKDQIDVSIYFSHEATDEEIDEVFTFVSSLSEVEHSTFFSRDEVLEQFRQLHADNDDILASLDELGNNPLGPTMVVKTHEPSQYAAVIEALSVPEYEGVVEAKTFADTQKAIERIDTITASIEKFSLSLTIFFALIAFLIILNTIRVAIYTQRTEISIKKLVGATNSFVRGPYMIESLIFSVVGVAITLTMVYFLAGFIDPYIAVVFGQLSFLTNYFASHILALAGIQFSAVFLLTLLSSMLAMRRYLRV